MQGILFKFLAYTVVQGFLAYMYVFNQKSILNTVNQRFQISGSMVHTDRIHCSTENFGYSDTVDSDTCNRLQGQFLVQKRTS